jgi:predicted nucleotidyltransferase
MNVSSELDRSVRQAAAILRQYGAKEVYVFGSVAAGTMHEGSDVDMAVEGLPPAVFFGAMGRAGKALGRALDLVDLDEPGPLTRYLRETGKLVRVA